MAEPLLDLQNVSAGYRKGVHAIRDVSLELGEGEAVGVIGMNGAGKSTLMNAIVGRVRPETGRVRFLGRDLEFSTPDRRARNGLVFLPEGHQVIGTLTAEQNLLLAADARTLRGARRRVQEVEDLIYDLFPILKDRSHQLAGLMSGGEQQMLSISRALVTGPKLLLLDEPSLGLAPAVVDRIYESLSNLLREHLTLIVVEQNDNRLRSLCNKIIVLNAGAVALNCSIEEATQDVIRAAYFGSEQQPGAPERPSFMEKDVQ